MRTALFVVNTLSLMLAYPALAVDEAPGRLISQDQSATCISESSIREYVALRVAGDGILEAVNKMNAGKALPECEVHIVAEVKRINWQGPVNISEQNFYLYQVKIQDNAGVLSSEDYYAAAPCGGDGYVPCMWKSR